MSFQKLCTILGSLVPISTRVDITVYQHGKCFIFLKCHTNSENDCEPYNIQFIDLACSVCTDISRYRPNKRGQ